MTLYVAIPLLTTVVAWGCAGWSAAHGGMATDAFSLGLLVGLGLVGITQSLYRKLLEMLEQEAKP